jgi:CBS domain-containing protein
MGIINFKGARKQSLKKQDTPIKVSDYMTTNLITFSPEQSIYEVIDMLIKHRISGAPVTNSKGELVGMISESDCVKRISDSRYYNMPMDDDRVEKLMTKNVDIIDGNLNVLDAASKFLEAKRRRFPIVENGKLVGQISLKDILKAAMLLKGQNWGS